MSKSCNLWHLWLATGRSGVKRAEFRVQSSEFSRPREDGMRQIDAKVDKGA
ncbi:MAG: hypothetical protein PHS17_11920 [Desulfobacterales bacterium]|nr:hypothetical protein [Desulfobacterales bacterium]